MGKKAQFLKSGIACAVTNAERGDFDLTAPALDGRDSIGIGEPEIIVAVHAQNGPTVPECSDTSYKIFHAAPHFGGDGKADRVSNVDDARSRLRNCLTIVQKKRKFGPRCIFGPHLHHAGEIRRHVRHLLCQVQKFPAGFAEFRPDVKIAHRKRNMKESAFRRGEYGCRTPDVLKGSAAHHGDLDAGFLKDRPANFKILTGSHREASFDAIDTCIFKRMRNLDFFSAAKSETRRLIAFAERRIENTKGSAIAHTS